MSALLKFQQLTSDQCIPLHAIVELTTACNFSCNHCYNYDRSKPAPKRDMRPLKTDERLDLIDQLADLGIMQLSFSGGEATLNRDLIQLCTHAAKAGMLVGLKSNGLRLTPEFFQALIDCNLASLEVTLYGLSPETQDAFVGVKGAFDTVVSNLQHIKASAPDLPLTVHWSILEHNAHEYPTRKAFHRQTGIAISPSSACSVRHGGDSSSLNHGVTPTQRESLGLFPKSVGSAVPSVEEDHFQCGCARTSLAVSAYGDVWPCVGVPWSAGSIREESLRDIWDTSSVFKEIRNMRFQDYEPCSSCELLGICSRRNSSAFTASGRYNGPDINAARVAEQQAQRLGITGSAACLADERERSNSESASA